MNRNRFSIALAAIVCGALLLSLADPASAFIRLARSGTAGVVQAHWFDSELPLPSVINGTNNDIPAATAVTVIQASAQSWQDVPTSYFTVNAHEYVGAPDSLPDLDNDGQNSVIFLTDLVGNVFPPGVIAFVRSIVDLDDGHTLDADMVFNDRDFFSSITSPALTPPPPTPPGGFPQTSVDLQSVITHEYGHYFSLDHTSVLGATMIPFISNNTSQRSLELDDRAGVSTVYPESASRPGGVTPGGTDFDATTGTISGTVLSGYNGSAVFGAHVEAFLLPTPYNAATSISAISGELTLRNGQGDYTIHGLPPGSYHVRIVPLDGVNTTAADINVGGPYNGLDINFEPEFWNGAGESGNGFSDPPNLADAVAVGAGAASTGVNFITNAYEGRVIIAQYGQFENIVSFGSNVFHAVRFDVPFDGPYTINRVEFPTFTFTGVPATFPSVRLLRLDPATGAPDVANPLFFQAPFNGSPNGINVIPINASITTPGETFYLMWQFPLAVAPLFPNFFPFLRCDLVSMERGLFGTTMSSASAAGPFGTIVDRNLTASMVCQLANVDDTPVVAPSNLGANRRATNMTFSYAAPGNARADGFPMPANSVDQIELVNLNAALGNPVMGTGGAGASSIKLDPAPPSTPATIFATRAVDKNGNRSLFSNITITGFNEGADEPNGRLNEAVAVSPPVVNRAERYSPAGDQDFFSIMVQPGDVIDASATAVRTTVPPAASDLDGRNDPDYVLLLYDTSGEVVAFNDDFSGLNPRVVFTVPPPAGNAHSTVPRQYRIHVTDFYGSLLSPTTAPRIPTPTLYRLDVGVTPPASAAAQFSRAISLDRYHFENSGPNPANPTVKLTYVIPKNSGAQEVNLRIFDVNGRLVRTLVNGNQNEGPYTAIWDGRDNGGRGVSSGNYYARITVGTAFTKNTQITLLK